MVNPKRKKTVSGMANPNRTECASEMAIINENSKIKEVNSIPYSSRCSLYHLSELANEIKDKILPKQLDLLRRTPFWSFYYLFHSGQMVCPQNLRLANSLKAVMDCYVSGLTFKIGSEELTMKAKDIALLFGMKLEGRTPEIFPRVDINQEEDNFVTRFVSKGKKLRWEKTAIESAIRNMAGDKDDEHALDFVKLLILYMCMTIFFVNVSGDAIGFSFYENIKDLETINSISWPQLIHTSVMNGLKKVKATRKSISGCVLSVLFWICDRINVLDPRLGYADDFPRVARWHLADVTNNLPKHLSCLTSEAVCDNYSEELNPEEQNCIGGIVRDEWYASTDEEENDFDTQEVRRLKRKLNSRAETIRQLTRKLNKMDKELTAQLTKSKRYQSWFDTSEIVSGEMSGINNSERLLNPAFGKKKILLILDLNGILGYFRNSRRDCELLRPHCKDFVRFCVTSFEQVLFWSSMNKYNTQSAVGKILPLDLDTRNVMIWSQEECTDTKLGDPNDRNKPWFLKITSQILRYYPSGCYNDSNTILVDDSPIKTVLNPDNTTVFPRKWTEGDMNDTALKEGGEIRKFLEDIPNQTDIQDYVKRNQPDTFRKLEADKILKSVWTDRQYEPRLRDILKAERYKPGSTSIEYYKRKCNSQPQRYRGRYQADVNVKFELPRLEDAEIMNSSWVNPQQLCSSKPASVQGKSGPFGLLAFVSENFEEQTAIFFRVFNRQNSYVVLMCSDQSRSSLEETNDKATYGAFIDVDPLRDCSIIDHSVVESFGVSGKVVISYNS